MYGLLGSDNIWPTYNYLQIWNLRMTKDLNTENTGAWKHFKFEDQGKFNLICLLENM